MIYRGKYCDLVIEQEHKKPTWKFAIYDKAGALIDMAISFETKSGAKSVGRRRFHNREEKLREKYIELLVPPEDKWPKLAGSENDN